ncbi:MAG: DPP IV N-terminal domain-containing protein [Planctomycetota bacterium]|nr:DPP IV N-terminal domain-containing protein [Planctomycetota bacterium]
MWRRSRSWLVLLALLGVGGPSFAEEQTAPRLTLEQVFGGRPFTRALPRWSWRPGHTELVRQGRGRVLRRLDPGTGTGDVLFDLKTLDAQVPEKPVRMRGIGRSGPLTYRFAKDGEAMVVNVKGQLVWVHLTAGEVRRLTDTKTPIQDVQISPDATLVSFARDNDLWVVAVAQGAPQQVTQGGSEVLRNSSLDWVYPEELHYKTGAWWAPDSQSLAYLQLDQTDVPKHRLPKVLGRRGEGRVMRYPRAGDTNPKARVGVVSSKGGETTWLDLGAYEYVARVAWTPNASRVLVATLDRPQQRLRLLSCNPKDGTSTVLFEETDAAWVSTPPAPRFVNEHCFLWRSHRDDTTRWYLVALDETHTKVERQTAVTPAGFAAGSILHLDLAKSAATFDATPHGSSTSSVYVGWGDRAPKHAPFVTEPGMWTSASLDESGAYAIVTHSDAETPPERSIWKAAEGELIRAFGNARTDRYDRVAWAVPEELAIPIEAGRIRMRLWKPPDLDARLQAEPDLKLPVIVQVYGGPGSRTIRNRFGRGPVFATYLTQQGYLVLQVDGRGTGAQGAAFQRTVYGKLGVLEIDDQARAVKHLAKRSYVDGDRVGMWGWSYGGTMACNAVTMQPDTFKVAVAVAPVTDWRLYDTIYTERYMNTPEANPEGYRISSSVEQAKRFRGHLLLMHGLGDDNVHAQNTYQLMEALLKAKKPGFEVMTYPWRGHGIQGATLDVYRRLVAYFDRHL